MSFEELNRVRLPLDDDLMRLVASRYRLGLAGEPVQLEGGDEAALWRVSGVVIRIAPTWKTDDEMAWVHDLVRHVGVAVPEAVAPLVATDGTTLVRYAGHQVSVFPFVEGAQANEAEWLPRAAGAMLARIHAAASSWPGRSTPRPRPSRDSPWAREQAPLPDELLDRALDDWHTALGDPRGVIHGDFYGRNLLCEGERIVGVLDWDEAHVDFIGQEVGWAIWEFAQDDAGGIDDEDAADFLGGYSLPLPAGFAQDAGNFIRWRLRQEMHAALTAKARGEPFDDEYFASELVAWNSLEGFELT